MKWKLLLYNRVYIYIYIWVILRSSEDNGPSGPRLGPVPGQVGAKLPMPSTFSQRSERDNGKENGNYYSMPERTIQSSLVLSRELEVLNDVRASQNDGTSLGFPTIRILAF